MHTTYRGIVKGGAIVLDESLNQMPDGTEVVIMPVKPAYDVAAAVLDAIERGPRVSAEDIQELERAIESGKRPRAVIEPFPTDEAGQT